MAGCGPRLVEVLAGRTLAGACRKGKYLWLQLDEGEGGGGGPWPVLHFGEAAGAWAHAWGQATHSSMGGGEGRCGNESAADGIVLRAAVQAPPCAL